MFDVQVGLPITPHNTHLNPFQVRVQRSFSFEELQSGSYFASLDESDLQFYRVYGQPVLIPSPDGVDANFVVHAPDLSNSLHSDYPPVSKSYTLQNPLGDGPSHRPAPTHDWQLVKQEPIEVRHMMLDVPHYLNSSRSCQLTLTRPCQPLPVISIPYLTMMT